MSWKLCKLSFTTQEWYESVLVGTIIESVGVVNLNELAIQLNILSYLGNVLFPKWSDVYGFDWHGWWIQCWDILIIRVVIKVFTNKILKLILERCLNLVLFLCFCKKSSILKLEFKCSKLFVEHCVALHFLITVLWINEERNNEGNIVNKVKLIPLSKVVTLSKNQIPNFLN